MGNDHPRALDSLTAHGISSLTTRSKSQRAGLRSGGPMFKGDVIVVVVIDAGLVCFFPSFRSYLLRAWFSLSIRDYRVCHGSKRIRGRRSRQAGRRGDDKHPPSSSSSRGGGDCAAPLHHHPPRDPRLVTNPLLESVNSYIYTVCMGLGIPTRYVVNLQVCESHCQSILKIKCSYPWLIWILICLKAEW